MHYYKTIGFGNNIHLTTTKAIYQSQTFTAMFQIFIIATKGRWKYSEVSYREGGDIGLFITAVPKFL